MKTQEDRWRRKGKAVPTPALIQQAHKTFDTATTYHDELVANGIKEELFARYPVVLQAVEDGAGSQKEARDLATNTLQSEWAARHKAKAYKRRLERAVKLYLADNPSIGLTRENFAGRLDDSTPRMVLYLDRVRPHVAAIDDGLKLYFANKSPLGELDAVKRALQDADTEQENLLESAPAETLKLNKAKGELLEMIERINDVAHLAFDGQAEILARFNKDLLLRASRIEAKAATAGEATAASSLPQVR